MKICVSALLLLLAGCATTPEVTAVVGPRRSEDGTEWALNLSVLEKFGKESHGVYGYMHNSEVLHGAPFNSDQEITTDQVGMGVRFGGKHWGQ